MKTLISLLAVAGAFYLGYGLFLYLMQRSMLYYPTLQLSHSFTEETFETGESIRAIVTHPGKRRAALYFGGNAEALAVTADAFDDLLPETTIYFVNYRGYAGSSGRPTEKGLYRDALAVFDAVRGRHESIVVMGRSLGAGIATYLAANRDIDRLLLITPFDSAVKVAQDLFPIYPASLLVREKYNSMGRVDDIDVPTLVLIAGDDAIIPRPRSQALVDAFDPDVVTTHVLAGRGHNDLELDSRYFELIRRFLTP